MPILRGARVDPHARFMTRRDTSRLSPLRLAEDIARRGLEKLSVYLQSRDLCEPSPANYGCLVPTFVVTIFPRPPEQLEHPRSGALGGGRGGRSCRRSGCGGRRSCCGCGLRRRCRSGCGRGGFIGAVASDQCCRSQGKAEYLENFHGNVV